MACCCNINWEVNVNECLKALGRMLPRPKSGIQKLKKEMEKLERKRDNIKIQIDQAEREGKIPTNDISHWLEEVETLEDQVAAIERDFQSTSCFRCYSGYSIDRRAAEKLSEAKELMTRSLDPIAIFEPQVSTQTLPIAHQPPIGIESYVEDIVGYIDGGEGNIIGIYGMGGVGKTTILNNIQRHYLKHNKFDRVIWVVASKDCQLKRLQMDIAKSLDLKALQESDDERTCGDKLFNYLKNKNCLLLLDDIWKDVDLQQLGMAIEEGQQQQSLKVVVLTTRNEEVCGRMKTEKKIKVECLDPDQAWQLFEQNSQGDVVSSDGGIKLVAQKLAEECAGLPLALVTVARAMTGKKSWEAWQHALHQIRDKHEWTTIGIPEDSLVMYKAFKLSYDSLENDSLRECLLCCALWPEDYEMDKFEELIPCWIGCGIIREFNIINEAFGKGCSHLDALMAASLLEYSSKWQYFGIDNYVKMHDVIRDMALLMVSDLKGNGRKWIVKTEIRPSHLPRQEEWQEAKPEIFMSNQITAIQEYEALSSSKDSMLILRGRKTITPRLFASSPLLTYLDIAKCGIMEFPMEICTLTELRYLNLSNNLIRTLPAEFGHLCKLEYLLLRYSANLTVPDGTISKLSMLRWLDIRGNHLSLVDWWLNELTCFQGGRQLSVGIDIATTHNIQLLNMFPNVSIWHLTINEDVTRVGDDASKLPDLTINGYGEPNISDNLEYLCIVDLKVHNLIFPESRFRSLKSLQFYGLRQLGEISLNGVELNSLRELCIFICPKLRVLSGVLQLQSLNHLRVVLCPSMKELISDARYSYSTSSIKILTLHDLPELTRIANRQLRFPYLEYIHVKNCPNLKNLSFGNSRLIKIQCDKSWWDSLEWDDQRNENSFIPYFFPVEDSKI